MGWSRHVYIVAYIKFFTSVFMLAGQSEQLRDRASEIQRETERNGLLQGKS